MDKTIQQQFVNFLKASQMVSDESTNERSIAHSLNIVTMFVGCTITCPSVEDVDRVFDEGKRLQWRKAQCIVHHTGLAS